MVLLKGYQSEGHDSAHSDFGGNIGRRMGGKRDMNILINEGAKWNADIGVHLNCTESYPEAKSFNETFVNPKAPGWGWLDQSYYIHHRQDLVTGNFAGRVKELMRDVPGLAFVYMDVYFGDGWEGLEMARTLQEAGIDVTTEFPRQIEHSAIWSHWSVDMTYGPDTSRGINSKIVRFIRNHQKDMFLMHPLLGHAEIGDFEGWQTRTNFYQFLDKVYNASLPAKYMQHFQIIKWTEHEIKFTEGVRVTDPSGKRQIFKGERLILDGGSYLLPWEPKSEKKLYHWNVDGGKTTWSLPKSWKKKSVKQYLLTDTGREFIADLKVNNGQITINAGAKKPYIIYPSKPKNLRKAKWGQGSFVKDPGFNNRAISDWKIDSDAKVVGIDVDEHGRAALKVGPSGNKAAVSQKISGLKSGVYSASVWVEVEKGRRKASLCVTPSGGETVSVWTDHSFASNYFGSSEWNRTRMQRMQVLFEVPAWKRSAVITLAVEPGESAVRFDNVRVIPTVRTQRQGYDFFEDFENVDEGWFPFIKGQGGGVEHHMTHLSERHSPYTDAGWNEKLISDTIEGDWSLKVHNEAAGMVYLTIPQTLRFAAGHKYEVSFDYQSAYDDEHAFVVGADDGEKREIISTTNFKQTRTTKRFEVTVEPGEKTDVWIGVKRNKVEGPRRKEVDLVIDNISVRDLGVAE
jgi:endo-alpha-N-acetylgalactosaminidase